MNPCKDNKDCGMNDIRIKPLLIRAGVQFATIFGAMYVALQCFGG